MWWIKPKHTFESVLRQLADGFADGSVVVTQTDVPRFFSLEEFLSMRPERAEKWNRRLTEALSVQLSKRDFGEVLQQMGL